MTDLAPGVLYISGLTDVGRVRSHNEDCFAIDRKLGLILVADGMGGHAKGDVASRTAVDVIGAAIGESVPDGSLPFRWSGDDEGVTMIGVNIPGDGEATAGGDYAPPRADRDHPVALIRTAVNQANRRIGELNEELRLPEGRGMGTTLAGLWMLRERQQAIVFHAGDSRVYRWRGGVLQQLTRDHSLFQAWLDNGGHGTPPSRNIIVRALGMGGRVDPEITTFPVEDGDVFLACSDGLTSMVPDPAIAEALETLTPDTLEDVCDRLIRQANDNGGRDNVTVVLARWECAPP